MRSLKEVVTAPGGEASYRAGSHSPLLSGPQARLGTYRIHLEWVGAALLLALAYFGTAKLGLQLASINPYATVVWPPTGIALASLLLLGYRVWPGVFLGAFLANVTVAGAVESSLLIATGNTLEGLIGAVLVNRYAQGKNCFFRPQDSFRYAVLAGMVATSVSATIGVGSLWMGGSSHPIQFGAVWLTWWLGDGTSVLTIAPFIILWFGPGRELRRPARIPELVALGVFTLAVGVLVFKEGIPLSERNYPLSYLCVSPLLWAALRFGPRETAAGLFLLSGMAVWGRLEGSSAFNQEHLLSLQVFLGLISVMVLPLAASIHERKATHLLLRRRERELTDFLENAVVGMHWVNAEGIILWANEAELSFLGYSRGEYIGRHLAEFHADPEMGKDMLWKLEQGEKVQDFEAKLKRKDGSIAHVLIDSNALRENGRIVHTRCFLRDISERKRAADELRRVNESLEQRVEERTLALARANQDLAAEIQERRHAEALVRGQNEILFQVASGTPLPLILTSIALFIESQSGRGFCAILMPGEEGRRLHVSAAPHLPDAYRQALDEIATSRDLDLLKTFSHLERRTGVSDILSEPHWAEYRSLARQYGFQACWAVPVLSPGHSVLGALIMHHASPVPLTEKERDLLEFASRIAGIAIERHRTLGEVHRVEERFRLLVEGVKEYAIYLLDPHGNVITWNDGAMRLKGYRADEIVGRHFSCFYTQEDMRALRPETVLRITAENGRHREEGWRVRKDGSKFFASVQVSALKTKDGQLRGFAKVAQDITVRREEQEKLKEYAARLHFLSRRLLELQETERRAIARELHDETGQTLSALKINLDLALQEPMPPSIADYIKESVGMVAGLLKQVRDLSLDLHPSILDDLGLVSALRWVSGRQADRSGFGLHFHADGVSGRLPAEIETTCFRIAQEALTNIGRHAEAAEVMLSFRRTSGGYEMVVQDDGKGFDADAKLKLAAAGESLGLLGMQERAHLIGAKLDVDSFPRRGARICLSVPLPALNAAPQPKEEAWTE